VAGVLRAAHFGTVAEVGCVEDVATPASDDLVHQPYEVRLAVSFLVLLGKSLDCLVYEVTQVLGGVAKLIFILHVAEAHAFHWAVVQDLKELPDVLLAVCVCVRLVEELEHADEDVEALRNDTLLEFRVEEEPPEDLDGGLAEVAVAQGDQEVVLHFGEDFNPAIEVFWLELIIHRPVRVLRDLDAGFEDFNVRPLQALQLPVFNCFLQGLSHKEGVPFCGSTVGPVLLSVHAGDVDFFFSASSRLHLQGAGANVLRAAEEDVEVSGREVRVEVHDASQVNEADFNCGLGGMRGEDCLDYLKEDGSVLLNDSRSDSDLTENSTRPTATRRSSRSPSGSASCVLLTL